MIKISLKYILLLLCVFIGCSETEELVNKEEVCINNLVGNSTINEIKSLFQGEVIQIQEELIFEAYISSSDREGNFFGEIHLQDKIENPSSGIKIELDLRDMYLFYPESSRVLVNCKGLYLGKSKGVYSLGGVFNAFGNNLVGRLPKNNIAEHISISCKEKITLTPTIVSLANITEAVPHSLIQLNNVQFLEAPLDSLYAGPKIESSRTLIDCNKNELTVLNSGYASFQSAKLPKKRGNIKGVLIQENSNYYLVIRDTLDVDFKEERCIIEPEEITSTKVFISEIADPNNDSTARFIELYNASSEAISLKGWTLKRYTNANTQESSSIDLSNATILAKGTYVISPNKTAFETIYGFMPDFGVGKNSPADSNGDDNLVLLDPFGTLIDVFGVIGEDGSGTNHEFEDGGAFRKTEIIEANPVYTNSEWHIFNDTGAAETSNMPKNAPDDYTPGSHKE